MANLKNSLIASLLLGSLLALALFLLASKTAVNDWIQPAFVFPYLGAVLLSGNAHSPSSWLIGILLLLQCCFLVLTVGWVLDRYRNRSAKA